MNKFNFDQVIKKLEKAKSALPKVLANDTKKFFLASWEKQGWDDGGVKAWAPRKYNKNKRSAGRAILVKSGALRRAVNASLKSATFDSIKFSVHLPYAQIHNEGGNIIQYVRPHKRVSTRTVTIRGNSGFVNGKFVKGRAKKMQINGVRHNVSGFSKKVKMPKRQYIGDSASLRKIQKEKIDSIIKNIWQA